MSHSEQIQTNSFELSLDEEPFPSLERLEAGYVVSGRPIVLSEQFEIETKITSTGLSTVYSAYDLLAPADESSKVAVKIYHGDKAHHDMRNTIERGLCEEIDHPNIIRSIGSGLVMLARKDVVDTYRYMATPLASEGTLANVASRANGMIDMRLFRRYIADAAEGLDGFHARGLVHRDIKPANILIDQNDKGETHALISDLGVVAPIGGDTKKSPVIGDALLGRVVQRVIEDEKGNPFGTQEYAAPEQYRGEINPKSDIWSLGRTALGIVGYGNFISKGYNIDELGNVHLHYEPDQIPIKKSVPRELGKLLRRTQHADPARRPEAQEIALAAAI